MSPLARIGQTSLRAVARTSPSQVRTLYTTQEHVAHHVRPSLSPLHLPALTDCLWLLQNFPFSYESKRKFAVKMGASLTVAFLVPFVAVGYQL